MDRSVRTILVVAVLLSSVSATGTVAAAEGDPSIAVAVNGDELPDGDRVVVADGNLTVRAEAAENLSSVVVRVDGTDLGPFYPEGSTFERTIDPDFHGGENDVQVIATDESDRTTSYRATVYRDSIAPHFGLEEPFTVEPGYAFPANHTVDDANVTLDGTVKDESNITDFRARIEGGGVVQTSDLDENSSFSLNTTLGLGNSTLTLRATDEFGNERRVRTRLIVEDEAEPSIEIRGWRDESRHPVPIQIRATDDVGLRSLTIHPERQPKRDLIEPSDELFDRGRHDVVRNTTLDFRYESVYNVTITATDVANNTVEVTKTIEYDPITEAEAAAPEIRVHENESGIVEDGTYLLSADVTNGSVSRVTAESQSVPDGNFSEHSVVYDGPERENVTIYQRVNLEPGRNDVRIRATDAFDVQHERTIRVDTRNDSHWLATTEPTTTTTSQPTTTATTTTPVVPQVTAEQEPPLTPVAEKRLPLSPVPLLAALGAVAVLLSRRAETE